MYGNKKSFVKKHPHPHTKKKAMVQKSILRTAHPQNSPRISQPFWHVTTCFFRFSFTLRECVFSPKHPPCHWPTQTSPASQDLRTPRLPGRKAASSYTSVIGNHFRYQMEVVWRITLKQFMNFIIVCLEKKALLWDTPLHLHFLPDFTGVPSAYIVT